METKNNIVNILLGAVMFFFILFSISTYYDSLSQYATPDEGITEFRIKRFLNNSDSVVVSDGSNISAIIVGYSGKFVTSLLDSKYKADDQITSSIFYTKLLPFTFSQVSIALLLLFFILYQFTFFILQQNVKDNYLSFLLVAAVFINFPFLKGIVKILKYDVFSLLFSLAAIIQYVIFVRNNKRIRIIVAYIFCALAMVEKDTSFSVVVILTGFEFVRTLLLPGKYSSLLQQAIKNSLLSIGIFVLVIYLIIPKFWFAPSKLPEAFASVDSYLKVLTLPIILVGIGALLLLTFYVRKKLYGETLRQTTKQSAKKGKVEVVVKQNAGKKQYLLVACSAIGVLLFLSCLLYQRNNMVDMSTINEQIKTKINNQHLFVSPEFAGASFSTLDKSSLITRIKTVHNNFRIFSYFVPEIIVLLFFCSPIIILLLRRRNAAMTNLTSAVYLLGIGLALLLIFSFLLTPVEPKYNLLPYCLFTLFSLYILIEIKNQLKGIGNVLICVLILLFTIRPSTAGRPAHFAYMNLFRSTEIENNDFLDMNQYNWWTWLGWGESNYACLNYIEQNSTDTVKVLMDYATAAPFHYNKRIIPLDWGSSRAQNIQFGNNELRTFLQQLTDEKIRYLVLSKNVANRGVPVNYIVKNYRQFANYVEIIGNIEFAWVFDVQKLFEKAGGPTADFYVNKASAAFNAKDFTVAIDFCQKALAIDSMNLNANINICAAYANLKLFKEAMVAARRSILIDPNSEMAKNNLNYLNSFYVAK